MVMLYFDFPISLYWAAGFLSAWNLLAFKQELVRVTSEFVLQINLTMVFISIGMRERTADQEAKYT